MAHLPNTDDKTMSKLNETNLFQTLKTAWVLVQMFFKEGSDLDMETTFEDNDLLCSSGNLGCMYIVHTYTSAESSVVLDRKPQSHLVG